jgi:hypothetical protein
MDTGGRGVVYSPPDDFGPALAAGRNCNLATSAHPTACMDPPYAVSRAQCVRVWGRARFNLIDGHYRGDGSHVSFNTHNLTYGADCYGGGGPVLLCESRGIR